MWIFTSSGFISAVHKNGNLQLRARDRQSLERLGFRGKRIEVGKGTDYPFRAQTTKEELKAVLCAQVDAIDYANFKNEVHRVRGKKFSSALHGVWAAMLAVEPKNALQLLDMQTSWRLPTQRRSKGSAAIWDRYDDWESKNRDMPEDLDDLPLDINSMSDEQWEEFVRTELA